MRRCPRPPRRQAAAEEDASRTPRLTHPPRPTNPVPQVPYKLIDTGASFATAMVQGTPSDGSRRAADSACSLLLPARAAVKPAACADALLAAAETKTPQRAHACDCAVGYPWASYIVALGALLGIVTGVLASIMVCYSFLHCPRKRRCAQCVPTHSKQEHLTRGARTRTATPPGRVAHPLLPRAHAPRAARVWPRVAPLSHPVQRDSAHHDHGAAPDHPQRPGGSRVQGLGSP